jgi:hypothetical protein
MAIAVAESKAAVSTDRRPDYEPLTRSADGSLEVLELFGHIALPDSHET